MRTKLKIFAGLLLAGPALLFVSSAVYPAAVGVPRATNQVLGVVKCDGATTNCAVDGTISAVAAAAGLTVGASTVTGGTDGRIIFDNAGVVGEKVVTGTGNAVLATNPVLTTPNLGTPSAVVLTNGTLLPIGGITGLGTGVGTALGVNVGAAGAFVTFNGALGTPSSATLTNALGLPLGGIAAIAANSVAMNATGGAAIPTAVAIPACPDSGGNHLNYTAGAFSCGITGGGSTTLTPNTTVTSGGAANKLFYDDGSKLQEATLPSNLLLSGGSLTPTFPVTAQSGTPYTIVAGDMSKLLERTYTMGATATTLPTTGTTGFGSGTTMMHCAGPVSGGQSDVLTLSSPGYFNGHAAAGSITLPAGSCVFIASDGTNYMGMGPFGTIAEQMANAINVSLLNTNANGFELVTGAASATVPTLIPNKSAATTGIGAQASGNLSEVIAGAEIARWTGTGLAMQVGKVSTLASATGTAGIMLPHGVAPTSPADGDLWTTTAGLFARINGATIGPFGTGAGGGNVNAGGTLTNNAIVLGAGTQNVAVLGSLGTTTTLLHGNAAGAPTFGAVSLTADVTGVLPVANGGTNLATYAVGDILYASGTGTVGKLADVATGQVLHSGGVNTAPAYSAIVVGDLPGSGATTANGQSCALNSTCTLWSFVGNEDAGGNAANSTNFICLYSCFDGIQAAEDLGIENVAPLAGTFGHLHVYAKNAPGAGQTYTYTIRKCPAGASCADTALTCQISGAATPAHCADDADTFTVAADDLLDMKIVTSASAATLGASTHAVGFHQ